jgi:SecD/SecF fusion protein
MPLPSERVKALRRTFEAELVKLGKAQVTENRVDLAVRRPASERDQALTELSAGSAVRLANLRSAATAYDALQTAMQAVRDAGTSPSVQLLAAAADAEKAYADARRNVMRTALAAEDIRAAAFASKRSRRMADENRVMVDLPSPRDQAVARLKAQHPDAESIAEIDRLIGLFDAYAAERTGFDDPADLKRILKGAGVLTFRITVDPGQHPEEARLRTELREVGAKNVRANDARWFEINDVETWVDSKAELEFVLASDDNAREFFRTRGYTVESRNGQFYMLSWDTRNTRLTPADGAWRVEATGGVDQFGRPAINFTMSTSGAPLLGALTRDHIGDKMAILLDDQVYTAPNLNSEISSTGQITGKFSQEDIRYVVRVLSGGSLQAKLVPEPISESTFGPELGADNLRMGLRAGILSAIAVTIFMVLYYFGFGMVAVIALVANSILILGAMSLAKASFTMPGIAGVILTFGMAVDSNVLIYERMREEFRRGADMKTSVRLGFDKALSAIVDSNITNLIVCLALYGFGTPEIRGFAITMGIGVVSTLIAALVISRLVFNLLVAAGWRWAEPTRLTTLLAPSSLPCSASSLPTLIGCVFGTSSSSSQRCTCCSGLASCSCAARRCSTTNSSAAHRSRSASVRTPRPANESRWSVPKFRNASTPSPTQPRKVMSSGSCATPRSFRSTLAPMVSPPTRSASRPPPRTPAPCSVRSATASRTSSISSRRWSSLLPKPQPFERSPPSRSRSESLATTSTARRSATPSPPSLAVLQC